MQIDAAESGKLQQPRRKNFSICDDDDHIGRKRVHKRVRFVRLEGFRLVDRQMQFVGALLYRRRL